MMSVRIVLDFDDAWAARLAPMVEFRVDEMRRHPLVEGLIAAHPNVNSVDELTVKQKGKLWIMFHLLRDLTKFEGQTAAESANQAVAQDLNDNFPLDVGPA